MESMMEILKLNTLPALIFGMAVTLGAYAADEEAVAEAEKLLDTMDMQEALELSMDQMLDLQTQANPGLAVFRGTIKEFLSKYMSYESLRPDMVSLYAEAFTADELRDINAFYATPTGQKTITVLPELMTRGGELGALRVQENMGELQQMIQDEALKLQAEQAGQSNEAAE